MQHIQAYINSVENSAISAFMYRNFDFNSYIIGFFLVFLFWCPNLVKRILIRRNVFNPSAPSPMSATTMPPYGSQQIAKVQLLCNVIFTSVALVSLYNVVTPTYALVTEIGFHDLVCHYQPSLLDRGPVIFYICVVCLFLFFDVLYCIPMAAQNIYKQLAYAKSRGLPVPSKVTSGVSFLDYIHRAATLACPWMMLTIDFTPILGTIINGLQSFFTQHFLLGLESLMIVISPAMASKYELTFLIMRNLARLFEGSIGCLLMAYTYTASDCYAMPYVNRAAMIYYFLIALFASVDLSYIIKAKESPMKVVYENDFPENSPHKMKQN